MRLGDRPLVRGEPMSGRRELRCAIELRADDSRQSPGRIVGTLITYGERARDRAEVFAPGALHWPEGGVILNEQHNRQAPILRFVPELVGAELRINAPVPDTQRGRDAATMIRNGTMTRTLVLSSGQNKRAGPQGCARYGAPSWRGRRWSTSPAYPSQMA